MRRRPELLVWFAAVVVAITTGLFGLAPAEGKTTTPCPTAEAEPEIPESELGSDIEIGSSRKEGVINRGDCSSFIWDDTLATPTSSSNRGPR